MSPNSIDGLSPRSRFYGILNIQQPYTAATTIRNPPAIDQDARPGSFIFACSGTLAFLTKEGYAIGFSLSSARRRS